MDRPHLTRRAGDPAGVDHPAGRRNRSDGPGDRVRRLPGRLSLGLVLALGALLPGAAAAHGDTGAFTRADGRTAPAGAHEAATPAPRRYPAEVRLDPRKVWGVVLKVNARLVNLRDDLYVGRPVERGEALAEFESAELETIQRTYAETFANIEYVKAVSTTGEEKLIEGQMSLRWRGLSEDDLRSLERTRKPVGKIRIVAPQDGYLQEIGVTEGQVVNAGAQSGLFSVSGATLFRVAEPGAVFVDARLPFAAAAALKPGDAARLHLPGAAGTVDATVEDVLPLAPAPGLRRTVRLRPAAATGLRDGLRLTVSLAAEAAHAH